MGSAMVPLDSSCRLSIVTIPLSVSNGNCDWFLSPNLLFPWGDRGPCLMQCYLRRMRPH